MTKQELAQLFCDYIEREDELRLKTNRVPKARRTGRLTFWLHDNMAKGRRVINMNEIRAIAKPKVKK